MLAVDSRDGTMMGRMSFLSTGEDESVVWLTASRRDKDETTVTCVTSAGSLWRFRLNTSLVTMSEAVQSGAGIGFMARWEAARHPELVEVMDPLPEWSGKLWLVTHVDLHRTTKVQAFLQFLKEQSKSWLP